MDVDMSLKLHLHSHLDYTPKDIRIIRYQVFIVV